MKKNLIHSATFILLLLISCSLQAQYPIRIHSHNDYKNIVPFYLAYSQRAASIECDMFLMEGVFFVGHDKEDLTADMNFEKIYLEPIVDCFKKNKGRAWKDSEERLQLLLEVKSGDTQAYIEALLKRIEKYPEVFNPSVNKYAVRIVLTGCSIPGDDIISKYPDYILFDGEYEKEYTPAQMGRIYMISTNLEGLTRWNGKGSLVRDEEAKVRKCISDIHSLGKFVRFWGAPDTPTAWNTLYNFGVDFVGTDNVTKCADFFSDWRNKNYEISSPQGGTATGGGTTRTDRLDKTTRSFKGFENDKLALSHRINTYTPSYTGDGDHKPIKNIIFLIGDGMGIAQIDAANKVNSGLTLLNMKHIGLISNSSKDAYTTDSAAAGSALATGESNSNRHISISDDGKPYPSLTDFFHEKGYACGVVTLGNVADATPAAFYAHNVERDNADEITMELLKGNLDILVGSGINNFTKRDDDVNIISELKKKGYDFTKSIDKIRKSGEKVICIDEDMEKAADTLNIGLLAKATRETIDKLTENKESKGFFLMVEGAKIDYAGHSRCLPGSIVETLSFDMAISEALKFADKNGETLVIVTADHETGGLTLIDGNLKTGHLTAYYVTNDHTPIILPVFSYGPHSDTFIGNYFHYEIPRKIKQLFQNN